MLLAFSLSSCSVGLAMTTTNQEMTIAVPVTRLYELQTTILKQEERLMMLQAPLTTLQEKALEQSKQLEQAQISIMSLNSNLTSARNSIAELSLTIGEQNQLLRKSSEELKAERNKWKIKTAKWFLIGVGIGYLMK